MSSLLNSYRKLTDVTNQGIFDNEEFLLSIGRVYEADSIENVFGGAAIVNFILTSGNEPFVVGRLEGVSDSEEFKIQTFVGPTFTVGTSLPLINQNVGFVRSALTTLVLNPTITDDGILGSESIVRGIAGQGNRSGLTEGVDQSLSIIQPNTSVLLRIINQGAAGDLDFYLRGGELPLLTPSP